MLPLIAVPAALTDGERERYQRTMAIEGFGEEAQGRLKAATVCCIGAGGLGGPVLQYLVAPGWGASSSWMTTSLRSATCNAKPCTAPQLWGVRRQSPLLPDCVTSTPWSS